MPIVQLDPELPLPEYAHEGDAGLDLYAREPATLAAGGGRGLVPTGISIAIPMGHGGFVLPRSGMAVKHGISVVNGPGLIDAAYRGEIKVVLINTDPDADYEVHRGDRIAQLVIQAVAEVEWQVRDGLDGTRLQVEQAEFGADRLVRFLGRFPLLFGLADQVRHPA